MTDADAVVRMTVNGREMSAAAESSVAAVLLDAGITRFRASVSGEPRAPLCGMGVCYECRVDIDGQPHRRACMVRVREGMSVSTGRVDE